MPIQDGIFFTFDERRTYARDWYTPKKKRNLQMEVPLKR
jgi:hypothetical protein